MTDLQDVLRITDLLQNNDFKKPYRLSEGFFVYIKLWLGLLTFLRLYDRIVIY